MISIIIVAYNEADLIRSCICKLKKQKCSRDYEIILADGCSTDATVLLALQENIIIVECQKGKAVQMNRAAEAAKGDILFVVHADMELAENTLETIQKHVDEGYDAGGFANTFKNHNDRIKSLGHWMNFRFFDKREQSDKGIFYGDNGIFVKKSVFECLGGFREISIMEDYDFSIRLRKQGYKTVKIKKPTIIVSARRHVKAGFFKTRFQWVIIRILFNWGVSTDTLAKWYGDVR